MATAEQLDSRCTIEIVGVMLSVNEPAMVQAVLARAARHTHAATKIEIFCDEPKANGWLEWTMRITYRSGHGITIGCIRRTVDAEVEFHS